MSRMKVKENQLRAEIRSWPEYEAGLVSFVEPGLGADTGISDCLFLVDARLAPVELKRGRSVVNGLRPSQRAWHRATLHNGGSTFGLTLTNSGTVVMFKLLLLGGLMSELSETELGSWSTMADLSFSDVKRLILAY